MFLPLAARGTNLPVAIYQTKGKMRVSSIGHQRYKFACWTLQNKRQVVCFSHWPQEGETRFRFLTGSKKKKQLIISKKRKSQKREKISTGIFSPFFPSLNFQFCSHKERHDTSPRLITHFHCWDNVFDCSILKWWNESSDLTKWTRCDMTVTDIWYLQLH